MKKIPYIYSKLLSAFGPQHWWPAETPFEVCVGAILTQNTSWRNVEKAIENLRAADLLSPAALRSVRKEKLARAIHSSCYYNQKTERLKIFARWFGHRMRDSFAAAKGTRTCTLRGELLSLSGVGPETADSMLLYAFGRPAFVVDTYTQRVAQRHGLIEAGASYDELKSLFESDLKKSVKLYNEYHALIVKVGNTFCRRVPLCAECPLRRFKRV